MLNVPWIFSPKTTHFVDGIGLKEFPKASCLKLNELIFRVHASFKFVFIALRAAKTGHHGRGAFFCVFMEGVPFFQKRY